MLNFNISIIISVFIAGLLSFFSPCIVPLLPVYIGYFSTDISEDNSINQNILIRLLKTLLFVLGISAVFFILGFGAGTIGSILSSPGFSIICGIIILFLGLNQANLIKIPLFEKQKTINWEFNKSGYFNVFLLGVVFSFGWTPCVGPILASVLSLSAQNANALEGGYLLLIYSLGLSIPFLILSLGASVILSKIHKINRYLPTIKLIGGLLIAVMGLWMIFSQVPLLNNPNQSNSVWNINENQTIGEDFSLNSLSGETISLSDYRGKPVCIKFWGTWCPSCLAGLEKFEDLANQFNSKGEVQILSIVAPGYHGEMNIDDFKSWAQGQQINFPILFDSGAEINQKYNLKAYPSYLFFDKDGVLAETKNGDIQEEEIINIIEKLN